MTENARRHRPATTLPVGPASALLFASLLLGCLTPGAAAEAGSRGERQQEWRSRLEAARSAADAGRLLEAREIYGEVRDATVAARDEGLLAARATDGLGNALLELGRAAEAETQLRHSAEMWERLLGPTQPRLANTLHQLGLSLLEQGKREPAVPVFERALSIWTETFGADSELARNTARALALAREPEGTRPPTTGR